MSALVILNLKENTKSTHEMIKSWFGLRWGSRLCCCISLSWLRESPLLEKHSSQPRHQFSKTALLPNQLSLSLTSVRGLFISIWPDYFREVRKQFPAPVSLVKLFLLFFYFLLRISSSIANGSHVVQYSLKAGD